MPPILPRAACLAALLLAFSPVPAPAAESELDTSFGAGGFLLTDGTSTTLPIPAPTAVRGPRAGDFDRLYSSCPGPDDTQMLTGMVDVSNVDPANLQGNPRHIATARLRRDGSLDLAYGRREIELPGGLTDVNTHVSICLGNGASLIARSVAASASQDCDFGLGNDCNIQIFRITAEGELDPSFGSSGVLTLDLDTVPRPGLGTLGFVEEVTELNAKADGSEYLLSGRVSLAPDDIPTAPFAARISASGQVLAARVIHLPGTDRGEIRAIDYSSDGDVWVAGSARRIGESTRSLLIGRLGLADLAPLAIDIGSTGNWTLLGGRMLRPDTFVVGAVEGAHPNRQPRVLVIRPGSLSAIALPPVGRWLGTDGAILPTWDAIAPLDSRNVLFVNPVQSAQTPQTALGMGYYIARAHIGDSAAEDRVVAHFGEGGVIRPSFLGSDPSCIGKINVQDYARTTLWNGQPLIIGHAFRRCDPAQNADWLLLRLKPPSLFRDSFE